MYREHEGAAACPHLTTPLYVAYKSDRGQDPTWRRLLKIMAEDRPYLNPYLMQSEVADKLHISCRTLCRLLARYGEMNFTCFINRFRIEQACRLMTDRRHDGLSIEALAEQAGFNSRASFYRAFRNLMGASPADYRKRSRRAARTLGRSGLAAV